MQTFIPTKKILKETVSKAVEEAVSKRLPEIIKKAQQKEVYSIDEVCSALDISRRHLQYLRTTKKIGYVKEGRKIYFRAEDLQEFFDINYIEANPDQ